jgi:hypothetical protein
MGMAANAMDSKYLIGVLKGATNMPEYREESAFYEEVKKVRILLLAMEYVG